MSQPLDSIVKLPVDHYRTAALHLAVHVNMGPKEKALLARLPKLWGIHQIACQQFEEHQAALTEERSALLSAGINIDKLEAYFLPSSK